jgi:hypothetical protein
MQKVVGSSPIIRFTKALLRRAFRFVQAWLHARRGTVLEPEARVGAATDPRITAAFPAEFAACQALLDFAQANRPRSLESDDSQGDLILGTYARSSKTYTGLLRLAHVGYGEQAAMLGRSLLEDMLVAHWIRATPAAAALLERFRRYTVVRLREAAHKHKRDDYLAQLPNEETRGEREALKAEFGGRHWTGLSTDDLVSAVEVEWGAGGDRVLLWQVYEFAIRNANHLVHHSHLGVVSTLDRRSGGTRSYNVGGSPKYIAEALLVAWFSYINTMDLVLTDEANRELDALYARGLRAFATVAE